MREIKFRGRRKNSSEWVYGAFLAIPKLCSYIYDVQPDGQATRYLVDEDTVGQYTGLKDVERQEIYEGDIVRCRHDDWSEDESQVFAVKYFAEEFGYPAFELDGWTDGESNGLSYFNACGSVRVIGNIYENPELLEG